MLDFGFYNEDCLPRMKEYPDGYFDLAIVDPPYGGGFTEGGGCQGWFSKYHQDELKANPELGVHFNGRGRSKKYEEHYNRFGQPGSKFERYKRMREEWAGETPPMKQLEQEGLGPQNTAKKS